MFRSHITWLVLSGWIHGREVPVREHFKWWLWRWWWWRRVGYWIIYCKSLPTGFPDSSLVHLIPPHHPFSSQQTWIESIHSLAQNLSMFPIAFRIVPKCFSMFMILCTPDPRHFLWPHFLPLLPPASCSRHKGLPAGISKSASFPYPEVWLHRHLLGELFFFLRFVVALTPYLTVILNVHDTSLVCSFALPFSPTGIQTRFTSGPQ